MAANPNPALITPALWYFVGSCLAMQPGTQNGGTFADKPGYHNTRNGLYADRLTNDYSVRLAADKEGPGDKTAAFDWTFPDAQNGQYGTIIIYGQRVRNAFRARDPRLHGWREVLIQADADSNAEGFDFVSWSERTPDSSHLWHAHFSCLRQYLNSYTVMNGMLSILAGESLETWNSGQSRYGGGEGEDVNGDQNRRLFNLEELTIASLVDMAETREYVRYGGDPNNKADRVKVPNKFVVAFNALKSDVADIKATMAKPAAVDVDAAAVAAALSADGSFVDALAERVAEKLAARLKD
jgi:hypothetical protein